MLLIIFVAACVVTLIGLLRLWRQVRLLVRLLVGMVVASIVVAAVGLVARLSGCGERSRATLDDTQLSGQRWLAHPKGFAFRHPGVGFVDNVELAEGFENPWTSCYAFTAHQPAAELVVCAIDTDVPDRGSFIDQVRGVRRGLAEALLVGHTPLTRATQITTIVTDDLKWLAGTGTAFIHVGLGNGVDARMKVLTVNGGLAAMFVFSRTGESLGDVVTSFTRR